MNKLIYFDDNNDLIKKFCGAKSKLVSKLNFSLYPENYKDKIAVCYGPSNYGEVLVAKKNNINFIYIDNCYFGTLNSHLTNLKPKKIFYRVVLNDFVLHEIIQRPKDRLERQLKFLKKKYKIRDLIKPPKKNGFNIVVVPPSGKVLDLCNLNVDIWIDEVIKTVKNQTDLNITIKERARTRFNRFVSSNIYEYLQDSYALITFGSMAAVEGVLYGVPSFIYNKTLIPTIFKDNIKFHSAAEPVSVLNIKNINERFFPEKELREDWLSSLAYGQFSRDEMSNGTAKGIVLESLL